jgi:hypothetical protein
MNDRFAGSVCASVAPRLAAVLGLIAGVGPTTACNTHSAAAGGLPFVAPLVTAAPAVSRAVPMYLDEIGRNGAFESVTVTPQVPGRIVAAPIEQALAER